MKTTTGYARQPDKTYTISERVCVVRKHTGCAYARNGNHHNPTRHYDWQTFVDGVYQGGSSTKRAAVKFGADIVDGVYK